MSIPGFLVRTAENNRAQFERARLKVSNIPEGLPSPTEMIRIIDDVLQHCQCYTQAAQDAIVGLTIAREQFAAATINPDGQ